MVIELEKKQNPKAGRTYIMMMILVVPVIVIVSLYFLIRLNPVISQFRIKTDIVEYGTLETSIEAVGVIARNEIVYPLSGAGHINWSVSKGEKVARQQKLADVLVSESDQSLMMEHEMLKIRIKMIESGEDMESFSEEAVNQLEFRIENLISDLALNIQQNQFELAYKNRYMLDETAQQLVMIEASQHLPEMSLEELTEQKHQIEQKMDAFSNELRAEVAGIFSAGSDGLENELNVFEDEAVEKQVEQAMVLLNDQPDIEMNYQQYRIIKEHRWNLFTKIPKEFESFYEPDTRVWVRDLHQDRMIRGVVSNTHQFPENQSLMMLEFNIPLEGWHDKRLLNIELIPRRFEGLIVPVSSIAERRGVKGIFRVDVNGYAVFMPIDELGRDNEMAALREGPIEILSHNDPEGELQMVETLRRYDQYILNPEEIQEGQRVR